MNKFDRGFQSFAFPNQRVSNQEKEKPEWYANCIDWIISAGLSYATNNQIEEQYSILNGNIPDEHYKKILNPYNATNERYKRFPAQMRNYDIMSGIIRRYVSEYIKNPHEFIVGANNPDVVTARDAKLRQEIMALAEIELAKQVTQTYQEYIKQGNDPQQFNAQEHVDINKVIEEFKENYIDEISTQGQQLLAVIDDVTEALLLYSQAYFDFVSFGQCYTYSDIVGNKLIKRVISPINAFPVPNANLFVEDYDMFAERMPMTYQQILDNYDEYLSEKDKEFLSTYYARHSDSHTSLITYANYKEYYPDVCDKFDQSERESFKSNPMVYDVNTGLYDVWHVVWRGEARIGILTYVNNGIISQRRVDEDYILNKELGDIDIEYVYEPQVYEGIRIGGRNNGIYPYKSRAIAYNREGKLPYNGLMQLLPGFGQFSIIKIVTPYQIFRNIVAYHREMAIAKNKLSVLLVAKSLLGSNAEETIYRMAADGVLYIDDEDDANMLKAQQIRMLNMDISAYIQELTSLMAEIDNAAKEQVDMTPQRYGEIANSAGKGVTEEAIMRGSMGSVIVEFMFDAMRERDCARDLDYTKLAWIDGLNTSYKDLDGNLKYISLDVNSHVYASYLIKAKNSIKEQEKLGQMKQFAFSAAQNGNMDMAIAAITGDNISSMKKLLMKFNEQQRAHEEQMKAMDQQLSQLEMENKEREIIIKAEEDRKTIELEKLLDLEIELAKADANMVSFDNGVSESAKQEGLARLESMRNQVEREKLQIEREKNLMDTYNKEKDREVKMKDIEAKLKIAKTNKNKYDKGSKSK